MEEFKEQLKRSPFKNSDGKFVIVQFPNWQLWGVLLVNILQRIVSEGNIVATLKSAHVVLILFWAYEELVRGDNLFRRILGAFAIGLTFLAVHSLYVA